MGALKHEPGYVNIGWYILILELKNYIKYLKSRGFSKININDWGVPFSFSAIMDLNYGGFVFSYFLLVTQPRGKETIANKARTSRKETHTSEKKATQVGRSVPTIRALGGQTGENYWHLLAVR